MNHAFKKPKPTLESLLKGKAVITGKEAIEQVRERERQKKLLEESIEFERRNRRQKSATKPTIG